MNLRRNQSGFSTVEIILVVVVIALVGAVGWLFMERQKDHKKSNQTSSQQLQTKQTGTPTDETANWLLYTAREGAFTVRVADGWVVEDSENSLGFNTFNNEDLALKPGTKAIVKPFPGGKDGDTGFYLNYGFGQTAKQVETPGQKQTSLYTKDGLEIEKYYWVISGQDTILGPQNGDTQYTYIIHYKYDRFTVASHSFKPGSKDYHDTVEKVLSTFHFD